MKFWFLSLIFLLVSAPAFALIEVQPGEYNVPAMVVPSQAGPVAVFNMRSLSECRILLTGKVAKQLKLTRAEGLKLRFKVTQEITGVHGEGTLLEALPLGGTPIPLHVGNGLKSEK